MFGTNSDQVVSIFAGNTAGKPQWTANVLDPGSGAQGSLVLNSSFAPYNAAYTQAVMGSFQTTGYAGAVLFYASTTTQNIEWGLSIVTASADSANPSQLNLTQGQEYHQLISASTPAPVTGSFVTGDFNGDGQDEIAALLTDYKTIQFFTVDPNSLAVKPSQTLVLPNALSPGATIVPGRYRSTGNVELVAVGQIAGGAQNPHFRP
jgi:hypothetical protein